MPARPHRLGHTPPLSVRQSAHTFFCMGESAPSLGARDPPDRLTHRWGSASWPRAWSQFTESGSYRLAGHLLAPLQFLPPPGYLLALENLCHAQRSKGPQDRQQGLRELHHSMPAVRSQCWLVFLIILFCLCCANLRTSFLFHIGPQKVSWQRRPTEHRANGNLL